jgi:hypothetical protein
MFRTFALLFALLSSAVAKPYELSQAEIDADEAREKAELRLMDTPHPELDDPNEVKPVPFSEASLQTQIYKEGEGCDDSQCGMSCTGINHGDKIPDDELKEMCGGCTNKPNKCAKKAEPVDGKGHDATFDSGAPNSVCKCNPMAEDWPIKADINKDAVAAPGPAKCEEWCTAPCGSFRMLDKQPLQEYRTDCGKCDEDYACNPQAKDWSKSKAAKAHSEVANDGDTTADRLLKMHSRLDQKLQHEWGIKAAEENVENEIENSIVEKVEEKVGESATAPSSTLPTARHHIRSSGIPVPATTYHSLAKYWAPHLMNANASNVHIHTNTHRRGRQGSSDVLVLIGGGARTFIDTFDSQIASVIEPLGHADVYLFLKLSDPGE